MKKYSSRFLNVFQQGQAVALATSFQAKARCREKRAKVGV
jgi:hypothetical protein